MGKVIFLLGLALAIASAAPSSKIESKLAATLAKSSANVLVSMKEDTSATLAQFQKARFASHGQRTSAVAHALQKFAAVSQKEATTLLNKENVSHKVFWITNQIYIRGATEEIVQKLASLESVSSITQEFEVKLDPIIPSKPSDRPITILAEWGVESIEAPAVWADGNTGEGVVVGGIDTGVRPTHKDLQANYRGDYGWLDSTIVNSQAPRDGNGHGTHTMGTILGLNGIGVAPGSKWMACKGLTDAGSGTNAGLIECGQFMACPTLADGSSEDCSKAPHVVSNSWGGGQANPFYNAVINAWHAAGITPVFANGNSGPECSTANSPADSLAGVIAVGATTIDNELAYFSSKGPTAGGNMKPDISAPGMDVKSAWITSDSSYNTISGTSMATPHVAGVVALMKSAKPTLTYEQIKKAIFDTATHDIAGSGYNCDSVSETTYPNHATGHGKINARAAVAAAKSA